MAKKKIRLAGAAQRNTIFQLLLVFVLISFTSIILQSVSFPLWSILLLATGLGFILTLNILFNIHLLEIMLDRLTKNLPMEKITTRWRWPLKQIFESLSTLHQAGGHFLHISQETAAYRDQLFLQVSKTAAQEERNRLARDLHDSIKQQIFSVLVSAAAVKARWDQDSQRAREILNDIEQTAQEAQIEMQAMLQQLRPQALENVGLIESLRIQCQALGYRTGAKVSIELDNLPDEERFPLGTQETIFRIVQEAFGNIARHARAEEVWLQLRCTDEILSVEIGDNGQGFDPDQLPERKGYGGMGLQNIRERTLSIHGTATISSNSGKGTTIQLMIPLLATHEKENAREEERALSLNQSEKMAHRSFLVGQTIFEIFIVCTLAYYDRWQIAMLSLTGFCTVFACFLWAQPYLIQVTMELGNKHTRSLQLHARTQAILVSICVIWILFCLELDPYLSPALWHLHLYFIKSALLLGSAFVSALLLIIFSILYYRRKNIYYRSLSKSELTKTLTKQLQRIIIESIACLITPILLILMDNGGYFHTITLMGYDKANLLMIGGSIICFWGGANICNLIHIFRWQYQSQRRDPHTSENGTDQQLDKQERISLHA